MYAQSPHQSLIQLLVQMPRLLEYDALFSISTNDSAADWTLQVPSHLPRLIANKGS